MPQGWLEWATRIQAIAQAGLAYAKDPFDRERYQSLRSLSLEIMEAHLQLQGEDERALLRELFASDTGYPTPKVDVRAFICQHDSVLLVKERADGRWALPGGWADLGRSPSEMAVREVAEEAGYEVRVKRLLSVWDENRHHAKPSPVPVYKICVACECVSGSPSAGPEVTDIGWFARGALPPLSARRTSSAQLDRLWHLYDHPDLPPDLD
jgi:ADP-ribose pyrophosphatase YjhB (NUDIX family)